LYIVQYQDMENATSPAAVLATRPIDTPMPPPLHPAIARQAGYATWTADPAIAELFAILGELNAIGARLNALRLSRPELGTGEVRADLGEVALLYERGPPHYVYASRVRANGGACAGLWAVLLRRREAWIDARLTAEGFAATGDDDAREDRADDLARGAPPVEAAWTTFLRGDGIATIPGIAGA
jgi:hypothetical protein